MREGHAAFMDIFRVANGRAGHLLRDGVRGCSLFCLAVSGSDCYHNFMSVQPSVLCKQDRDALVVPSNK